MINDADFSISDEYFDREKGYCATDCSEMDPIDRSLYCPDDHFANVPMFDISDDYLDLSLISSDYYE